MCDIYSKDDELWALVKTGNKIAFTLLYKRYVGLVFSALYKRIEDNGDAEDITQEIFLSLWEKRESIDIENRLYSYLYGTIQNKVLNYFRSKRMSSRHIEAWDKVTENIPVQSYAPAQTELVKIESLVTEEQDRLPGKMKKVYELRYIKNMTIDNISDNLNISPNTVRNHLKEVRRRFTLAVRKEFPLIIILSSVSETFPEFYQIVNCLFRYSQI